MKNIILITKYGLLLLLAVISGRLSFAQGGWEIVYTNTDQYIEEIFFIPGSNSDWMTGWAIEQSGNVIKTDDGGDTWTTYSTAPYSSISGICFVDENNGWICTYSGQILKSTNGGASWSLNATPGTWLSAIKFSDSQHGVVVGTPCLYTDNGGTSWKTATGGMAFNNMCYGSGSTFWACEMWSGTVAKSTNYGHTWSNNHTIPQLLVGLGFYDANTGLCGGSNMNLEYTQNGGTTWTSKTLGSGSGDMLTASYFDANTIWAGTSDGIYKSINGGSTWAQDTLIAGVVHRAMFVTPTNTIYVAGDVTATFDSQIWRKIMVPPLVADFTSNTTTLCYSGTVNFFDNSVGLVDTWNWIFEGGNPATSTLENPVVTYDTPGTYDVQLTVSHNGNNSVELKTDYITVNAPLVVPSTPTGPVEVCGTNSYDYMTTSLPYADSDEWAVNPATAGTMSGDEITGTFTASANYTGTYTIKVRAVNECESGPWSGNFTGTLYHNPVQFDMLGDGAYCEGNQGADISLSGSETGVSYELFKDNVTTGIIISGTGDPVSFGLFTEIGLYMSVGITDNCSQDMIGQVYVHMQPLPGQAAIPQGPVSTCNDEVSDYSTGGASGSDDYNWILEPMEAGVLTANGEECSIAWDGGFSGTVSLSVAGVNECGSGTPSDELTITVYPIPQPSVSGPGLVCDNEAHDYSTADNNGSAYSWEVTGGTVISGTGTYQITVSWGNPGNGTLMVTETTSAGCENTSSLFPVTIDDCTGIGEGSIASLLIYPNPAKDQVHIQGLNAATIEISNFLGDLVWHGQCSGGEQIIDISTFPQSYYLVRILQAKGVTVFKLLKL